MKLKQNFLILTVPPIERWPRWLVSVVRLAARLVRGHQQLMLGALLVLLVPATFDAGITIEAVALWAFALTVRLFIAQTGELIDDCHRTLTARGY